MKKFALALVLALVGTVVFAEQEEAVKSANSAKAAQSEQTEQPAVSQNTVTEDNWAFIEGSALPGLPESAGKVPVCGVNIGFLGCANEAPVYGVSCAVCYDGSKEVIGLQASPVTGSAETCVSGLQFGLANFAKKVCGVQLGLYNEAEDGAFQIGVFNYIKNGWLPYCLVINCNF